MGMDANDDCALATGTPVEDPLGALAILERWDGAARKVHTPCGEGTMPWRIWERAGRRPRGAPVVLVHGGAGAWSHWIRNLPALTGRRTVVAPDLPGLGEAGDPPPPGSPERIAGVAAHGLGTVLPDTPFHLVGFSFGGMIGGLMAARLPRQVRSVILIGASGLGGRFDPLPPVVRLPPPEDPDALRAAHVKNLRAMMLHAEPAIDELAIAVQARNAPRTRVRSPEHALGWKLRDALAGLLERNPGVRLASLWGAHCIFAGDLPRRRAVLAALRPEAPFHVVAGGGHWVQYERAGEVNELLEALLAGE